MSVGIMTAGNLENQCESNQVEISGLLSDLLTGPIKTRSQTLLSPAKAFEGSAKIANSAV
ncbi:MAG: hypothetical protein QNK22_10345 [Xanthomonadales bacterium]|nr:hypothetical protein [Xanthomonadales bacterium]